MSGADPMASTDQRFAAELEREFDWLAALVQVRLERLFGGATGQEA